MTGVVFAAHSGVVVRAAEPMTVGELHAVEMRAFLHVDVDGAPKAYGPPGVKALDFEKHAHVGSRPGGKVVGYLTHRDGRTPVVQGPKDPAPGYYISTTGFYDRGVDDERDPRRYLNAARVNYVVLGDFRTQAWGEAG